MSKKIIIASPVTKNNKSDTTITTSATSRFLTKISLDSKISLIATAGFSLIALIVSLNDYLRSCIWLKCAQPSFIHNMAINWDGGWYNSIIAKGYYFSGDFGSYSNIAFFPGAPLIGKLAFTISLGNPVVYLGLIILFNITLLFLTVRISLKILSLISGNKDVSTKLKLLLALLITSIPSILFWISPYSEPLLLFSLMYCYYFTIKKDYLKASIFAGIASSAKSLGIIGLFIILVFMILDNYKAVINGKINLNKASLPKKIGKLIAIIFLSLIGIIGFSAYQKITINQPLGFVKIQGAWARDSNSNIVKKSVRLFKSNIINIVRPQLIPEGKIVKGVENESRFYKYVKLFYGFYNTVSPLIMIFLFLYLVYKFYKERYDVKPILTAFMASGLALAIPLSTGTFGSMNRYSILGMVLLFIFYMYYLSKHSSSRKTLVLLIAFIIANISVQAIFMSGFVASVFVG